MRAMMPLLQVSDFPPIKRDHLQTLQINLGYRCNQACFHCHVNAGPNRSEKMQPDTVQLVMDFLTTHDLQYLDITGGAPELHPQFRQLVAYAHSQKIKIMDRCNLTVLETEGQEDTAGFLAEHQVEIIASLPCYIEDNVDAQRGDGVFQASVRALTKLNQLGYGQSSDGLQLHLAYNPLGAKLPPPQIELEKSYKQELKQRYGISFNQLFTITNMPIARFGNTLINKGEFTQYMQLLKQAHLKTNLQQVMCRELISVDYQGYVYDCDFNQMLHIPLGKQRQHLSELMQTDLYNQPIATAEHCYGCTAGQGSSCGGALNE